jgi:hypothetical protein
MKAYSSEKALPFVSCNIINTRETYELTIQRNWQYWVNKTQDEENKAKTQYNTQTNTNNVNRT